MKKSIAILLFVFSTVSSFAQIDLENILENGTSKDIHTFLKGYLQPVPIGFGYGINGGWYSTAKAHNFLGLDLKVIVNASLVPTIAETFTFNNADYQNIKLDDSSLSSAELPTIFGSKKLEDRPLLHLTSDGNSVISTSTLPGSGIKESIGYNVIPSAMIQLGVGLFSNTDIKIRFVPKQSTKDYEFSTFGIGIMHDLKQWIPFVKRLPFDVSAMVAWNDVKSKFTLDADKNQSLEFNTKTFLYQLVASKKMLFLTVFGGVGMSSFNSDVNILGDFKTTEVGEKNLNYTGSSFRGNLGLNLKLLFLNLSADYAIQEYDTLTVTVGFSIR